MAVDIGFLIMPTPRATNPLDDMVRANRVLLQAVQDNDLTAWFVDHFQFGKQPYLECWTQMAWSAGRYPGIKTGTLVLGQGYRNPALVAKAAASFQFLNGGGLTLGIGAGWKEDEYRAYGFPFPSAGQRLDELEESVQIIRGMWTEESFTLAGRFHRVDGAICEPQPNPAPTLMIGGGGEKRTLRLAAQYADMWNVDYVTAEQFGHKVRVLHDHCRDLGRDPGEVVPSNFGLVSISDDPDKVLTALPPNYSPSASMIGGNPDEVYEKLMQFVALGAQHIQLTFLDYPSTAGIELFLSDVLPRFKEIS
jgi:alkanesulfonate monooxygenase SsuD/methylene tetrahydromethanopterin reductase-like flavin-dependent oxidoreductase (luciferase family)